MRVNPKQLIRTINKERLTNTQAAQRFGIHRTTVYRWKKKAKSAYGIYSSYHLIRKSTRPRTTKILLLDGQILQQLYRLRKQTGWTAEKLVYELGLSVSSRTVH